MGCVENLELSLSSSEKKQWKSVKKWRARVWCTTSTFWGHSVLYNDFQEEQLNSRFTVFREEISNYSRFPVLLEVVRRHRTVMDMSSAHRHVSNISPTMVTSASLVLVPSAKVLFNSDPWNALFLLEPGSMRSRCCMTVYLTDFCWQSANDISQRNFILVCTN